MGQEGVGQAGQPVERLGVVGDERLVGQVAAGQHDRPADRRQQQVVERRVGQEDAEPPVAVRRPPAASRGVAAPAEPPSSTIGRAGERQQASLGGRRPGPAPGRGEVADHHRERLGPATLAVAQPADGRRVGRVAGEVVAAQPLDRDDPAGRQVGDGRRAARRRRGRSGPAAPGRPVGQPRAAGRAGDRLGVEAAVGRVAVLGRAGRAEREGRASMVWARSYGSSSMIVARGPQFVQLVNG